MLMRKLVGDDAILLLLEDHTEKCGGSLYIPGGYRWPTIREDGQGSRFERRSGVFGLPPDVMLVPAQDAGKPRFPGLGATTSKQMLSSPSCLGGSKFQYEQNCLGPAHATYSYSANSYCFLSLYVTQYTRIAVENKVSLTLRRPRGTQLRNRFIV